MNFQNCIDTISKAAEGAGRKLTDDELDELLTALQERQRYLQTQGIATDASEAAMRAADDIANRLEVAALIEKRNAALNAVKRLERGDWLRNVFGKNIAEGLEAMLVGVNRAKLGARSGVIQVQKALRDQYVSGFIADIERTGSMQLFKRGVLDQDIARAMYAFGREDEAAMLRPLPKEAVDLARVIEKWQEVSRVDANAAGAWINKRVGYIVRQSHNPERIRRAGFATWRAKTLDKLDLQEMGPITDDRLQDLYNNLASGNHLKEAADDVTGFKGPANIAKKLSQSRELIFKDADAWFEYNQEFGNGNLRESVIAGLTRSAESTGMMRVLGTNPRAMFDLIRDDAILAAKKAGDLAQVTRIQDRRHALDNFMAAADGSMNIPGNAMWARRAANTRAFITLTKLGGMLLAQLNDVAVYGSGVRYQGRGFFTGMTEAISGLGRNLKSQEQKDLAASIGVVLDNMAGELGRDGTFSETGGLTKHIPMFMKLNLSEWWTSRMRASAAFGMSHHMALNADRAWANLGAEYQRVLSLYGIAEKEWDSIRASSAKHVDGKVYIVPENVQDAVSAEKLRQYFNDQTSFLALEPDQKTRAYLLQSSKPGTWTGEMARFLMQFKSFTGAYMQKVLGRELFGTGFEGTTRSGAALAALRNENGQLPGLVQLILASTVMGYGSMALKDMAKGRTPRDPTESPQMAANVFLAAMVQGGGAGIYGDFLFGESNRFGGGFLSTLAGPGIGTLASGVDLYQHALRGEAGAAEAIRYGLSNTPYANLFYSRIALDYLLLYGVQEAINPGYLRRMERDMEQKHGQQFMLRPSSTAVQF